MILGTYLQGASEIPLHLIRNHKTPNPTLAGTLHQGGVAQIRFPPLDGASRKLVHWTVLA